MEFSQDTIKGHTIQSYDKNVITIDEKAYHTTLLLTPTLLIENWPSELNEEMCHKILEYQPEVVLYGSGETLEMAPATIIFFFHQRHIGFETMTTYAACRTYNILAAEERKVLAILTLTQLK